MEELRRRGEKQAEAQAGLALGQLVRPSPPLSLPPWGTSRGHHLAPVCSN